MAKVHGSLGFSLLESLLACVIIAVLTAGAAPNFSQMLSSARLRSEADAFHTSLSLTRSEAIRRNARAVMCKSATGAACTTQGGWNQGWIVFHDANNNAELDAGESILQRQQALGSQFRISGNGPVAKYVSYTGHGTANLVSGAFQAGTLTFCKTSSGAAEALQIVINSAGRAKRFKTTVNACV